MRTAREYPTIGSHGAPDEMFWRFIKLAYQSILRYFNPMPNLKENPTLTDFQKYVVELEKERGFSDQDVLQKCILLGEEVGELFKAIRKQQNMKIDTNSKVGRLAGELSDIFTYLCAIANRYDISLEKAFRDKEEINKTRSWE